MVGMIGTGTSEWIVNHPTQPLDSTFLTSSSSFYLIIYIETSETSETSKIIGYLENDRN